MQYNKQKTNKRIHLTFKNINYFIDLKVDKSLMSNAVEVYTVDENDYKTRVYSYKNLYFEGTVNGDTTSYAFFYINDNYVDGYFVINKKSIYVEPVGGISHRDVYKPDYIAIYDQYDSKSNVSIDKE
ncbi:hypothetical protein A3Q56_06804 [Intoshia linei]|uniref:Uncharacterized protein n=1 Tax=Intoshia linei TaxID=1819745 RepID=A0A177AVN9_9BILA|nr:hypothetical protein A3Q56_06804 [Intoshia linei]